MKRLLGLTMLMASFLVAAQAPARADVILGTFDFNSAQFGNTLIESDGGTHSGSNWLNVVNVNPGNPGFLTGANFDTGIANIGIGGPGSYTIGYNTPIVNTAGDDLGVVVARYSDDDFFIRFSTDGGSTFTPLTGVSAGSAVPTGATRSYFYSGGGPFGAGLFVHPLDLSTFGLSSGAEVDAIQITVRGGELDLIRAAGLNPTSEVPEPALLALLGAGLFKAASRRRRLAAR